MSDTPLGDPSMGNIVAVYGGTFDPVTLGHLDIIRRGAALFGRLRVLVARSGHATLFTGEERLALLRPLLEDVAGADAQLFDGLLVDRARDLGARALLRGVRGARDLDAERPMAFANRSMAPGIDTVFLAASAETGLISSSLVREVASLGGDVSPWVTANVAEALAARYPRGR